MNMNKRKKVAWILLAVSIVLIATTFVLIFIDDYFNCLTVGSVMKPVAVKHKVSASKLSYNSKNLFKKTLDYREKKEGKITEQMIARIHCDDVEYHEIPTSYIYQDGRLRKYASYSNRDSNYYFLEDAKGYFSINTNDTSIIKPYQQAFEIDVFKQSSGMYAAGAPISFLDGLFWNNFTFSTEGVGCIKVFDLNNILFSMAILFCCNFYLIMI